MATANMNMREVRDTKRLKALLRAGKTVVLRDRHKVVGRVLPEPDEPGPVEWPDFAARAKAILGDRKVSGSDLLMKDRGRY